MALVATAPDPGAALSEPAPSAVEVVDRFGFLLRYQPATGGDRSHPVDLDRVSPHLVHAVLAAEDQRFFRHPGIDLAALLRAAWQDARAARIVSGASTLSMQLARMLDPHPRGVAAKLAQIRLALRLEATRSKRSILAAYLSRVPLGNRVTGFEAGARVYFGKPASQLSPAEAALLAAIPRAPSRINPWRQPGALRARRDAILTRMHALEFLDQAAWRAAIAEDVILGDEPLRWRAPHFVARALAETAGLPAGATRLVTTLDAALQARVEIAVRRRLDALADHGVGAMAAVVLDLERGEWLALEGSGGFFDRPGGQQDGTRTARQPGSALKPFTYALAFDGGLSPATVLADLPTSFVWGGGTWTPRNYDERYHGPLTARAALAGSVNVPAAIVLERVGPARLLAALRSAGITTLTRDEAAYGLGLTLGAGEVRLDELTAAYGALLRNGLWRPARSWRVIEDAGGQVLRRAVPGIGRQVFSARAAAQVADILANPEARAAGFGAHGVLELPFPAAVKTGTSEGFHDNWCVGGTREVVVGVWAGNFDRAPMGNVSGVTGTGAVWREIIQAWAELRHPGEDWGAIPGPADPPAGLTRTRVCALSGLTPGDHCPDVVAELLGPGQAPPARCDWHIETRDHRTVVAWPPTFASWAAAQGLATPALRPAESGSRSAGAGRIAVLTPANGDVFMLTPDLPARFQTLELTCTVEGAPATVTWRLDGRPRTVTTAAPFSSSWPLEAGRHRIEAEAEGVCSRPVEITVLGRPLEPTSPVPAR